MRIGMSLSRRVGSLEERLREQRLRAPGPLTMRQLAQADEAALYALYALRKIGEQVGYEAYDERRGALVELIAERWRLYEAAGRPAGGLPDKDEAMRRARALYAPRAAAGVPAIPGEHGAHP